MNLRNIPGEVYVMLVNAAEADRQLLPAFVIAALTAVAQIARLDEYVAS